MNFGPQHPAAHGVLRLILELDGECVVRSDPHIGLLHRGTEKLMEHRTLHQGLPYIDRLDYVSMMSYEHAYTLCVEGLTSFVIDNSTSRIRMLFIEMTRILNHLMAITTHALDVGALTPFLWAFEERERMMEFYERVSGARMHAAWIRPHRVLAIDAELKNDIQLFIDEFPLRLNEIEEVLTSNRIWRQRLVDVGCVSYSDALDLGFSGPMLRASGIAYDARQQLYECYSSVEYSVPIGNVGDCYDRYLVRVEEMRQSLKIMHQVLHSNTNTLCIRHMEDVIDEFKPMFVNAHHYTSVEAPKGELGVYIAQSGTVPERVRIRAPGFVHLSSINALSCDHMIADVVTIIGSQDVVFGEIDR